MENSPFRQFLLWLIGAVCLALVIQTFALLGLVAPVTVSGSSMEPTLNGGQRVFVDRSAYVWRPPQRWDVIVFRCPQHADQLCVKRVAGLPAERIEIASGELTVDGQRVPARFEYHVRHEDWAAYRERNPSQPDAPVVWQLGPDEYFVLGDNGRESDDSRSWWHSPGLQRELIVGRAIGVR